MNEISIRCDCIGGTHYITFHKLIEINEPEEIYIDLVSDLHNYSFWRNLKQCWRILRGKDPYIDSIIVYDKDKRNMISDFFKVN